MSVVCLLNGHYKCHWNKLSIFNLEELEFDESLSIHIYYNKNSNNNTHNEHLNKNWTVRSDLRLIFNWKYGEEAVKRSEAIAGEYLVVYVLKGPRFKASFKCHITHIQQVQSKVFHGEHRICLRNLLLKIIQLEVDASMPGTRCITVYFIIDFYCFAYRLLSAIAFDKHQEFLRQLPIRCQSLIIYYI